ncbi:mitochondrial outer membrane import complex protein METAXIN isoform X2 [Macadamia integrifolia]|uniref:mitochondrial outer membrane import complex protein METAXIN isoform X2 n=1 Tax=Macadamia integrifolia TaxID=60698 RepID=UPI001C501A42|nr:mitochondrial outer membrane import complex protein METAXIN isoform X2 [Macadamia integrifolia]
MDEEKAKDLVLVARKACFGLPTACPACLPVYCYLRLANVPFDLQLNVIQPDSDQIPYVEYGNYVAYNNEKGGVMETLKEDGIVDLDSGLPTHSIPEWVSTKAMISSWLVDGAMYELWVGSDGSTAHKIYYSDLPWPIGKILYFKQVYAVKQLLGITKVNAERREAEIYKRAAIAYEALSTRLGEQTFFFENRLTSLDAIFLGHALFVTQALPYCEANCWGIAILLDILKSLRRSSWKLIHCLHLICDNLRLSLHHHQLQEEALRVGVRNPVANPRRRRQRKKKRSEEEPSTSWQHNWLLSLFSYRLWVDLMMLKSKWTMMMA